MDMSDKHIADLLQADSVEGYTSELSTIANELSIINANYFLLDKILNFRFDLFLSNFSPFWEYAEQSFFESIISGIWKISIDNECRDSITINKVKNKLLRVIKPEYRAEVSAKIEKLYYEGKTKAVFQRINEIRNNYVAHFNFQKNAFPTKEDIDARKLNVNEIKNVIDISNSIFNILSFNSFAMLPPQYYPDIIDYSTGVQPTDIDQILDSIARNSEWLNMPEKQSEFWQHIKREGMSGEEMETFNFYRRKFGMTEIH